MSEMKRNEWKMEQERVDKVIEEISYKATNIKRYVGHISSDILEIRKTFWNDVTVDFSSEDDIIETAASLKQQAELLSERERTHKQNDNQLKTLGRLKDSPYFGRIDILEKGEQTTDQVYLGVASFMDKNDENFLIYDWRAPISSLYYDFAPGPVRYETLEGIIEGEMELKRQFIIKSAKINGMFDTGVTIGDEMLQEVLGNDASTQMKSIVATIQREQNQIIRNEKSKLLIVQGVAGSGKTSAALQRIAYLLYRYRKTIKSENIMLFSPNPLFNSYVATVLPELGEENMQQSTFQEYLNKRLGKEFDVEDPFEQMEFLLSMEHDANYDTRLEGIRFKASLQFKKQIDDYVLRLSKQGMIFKDLIFRKEIIFSKEVIQEYFYALDENFSIPNRIKLVKEWLLKGLKRRIKQERTKEWVEEELQFLGKEDFIEAYNQLQDKDSFTEKSFDDFEKEQKLLADMVVKQKFKPLFAKVKKLKFIDIASIYQQLFEEIGVEDPSFPSNWDKISNQTIEALEDMKICYEDATPFVYLQDLLEGRKSNTAIRHIFIDEAQDYSPFQFATIQMLFPYSRMTLLGDFNQAVFSGATGAATVLTDFSLDGEDVESFYLTKTYRSTKPIVEFTSSLIEGGREIEPFNREGQKPTITLVEVACSLNEKVVRKIQMLQNDGHRTIAVICRTATESKTVFDTLRKEIPIHLIEKGTISYEKGILVIPAYLAKGIEFDAVILYDSSQYRRERERKLFYTACTRAMHVLHMFATDGISPLIKDVPIETYEMEI
ncbi:RNA polymerase recycling motor HelD [Neobacillus sp. PS3-40]|uniref:RNA polymerase recycling motor HelD n=1 Tax=Neobacillus sp. PS3-40 TaxID=3070679 RepID=UPI0027E0053A|nr:RNA polymerase recycling motor HelD [Neobacillus sp. PS3-40]WML44797.1 RNA polymerase recycling motor HelD [Neobacillus sp. PS3-40]